MLKHQSDIENTIIIESAQYETSEEWVKEYIEQFGEEPTFF